MQHAVYAPTFNDYGEPARLIALAQAAEQAGYDGFFIWDHLALEAHGRLEIVDATVMLGALAQATSRLRLGAMITPLARRRPWKVAKEMATLDRLSGGRMVLGVGLGEPAAVEFEAFGEDGSARGRAARLDEGLELFDALVRGEQVNHRGQYYQLREAQLAPRATQTPRMPIWVAASLPARAGVRRAARWDGIFPVRVPQSVLDGAPVTALDWTQWWLSPADFRALGDELARLRDANTRFDVVASGRVAHRTAAEARAEVAAYAAAGASWWCEWVDEASGTFESTLAAIARGPAR
jgi:alkanesulfonate monooxygenase SsuD/methylene tetrahydromethanopterin reductase-like flavin-dependent oxidoreductase (luciferase family)